MIQIINLSLQSGVFPESWKKSFVRPIQKVTGTTKAEEFRPVNMLPLLEKVLEKVVHLQLKQFLDENNIIINEQSGFREKHSCETAINFVLNDWRCLIDGSNKILAVFIDLQRAFETVDRPILLDKLYDYGIRGSEWNWFNSYLSNRTQCTVFNNLASEDMEVKRGVPQGSLLGTLLFIIYINDMIGVVKYAKLRLFADDALLYISGSDISLMTGLLRDDLEALNKWIKINKLKLNTKKTKGMVLKSDLNVDLVIDNEQIEIVSAMKYLGVFIDNELKFRNHIDYICKKVSKKIGFFYRIRNRLSMSNAIKVYNVIIKPHFEYCPSVLLQCSIVDKTRLQKLQNKAMRCIIRCDRLTPISFMLNTLKWLNINQRIVFNVLVFAFKLKCGLLPSYLSVDLRFVSDVQPYNLRNNHNFRLNFHRTVGGQNRAMYKGLAMYNNLPNQIKNASNIYLFKKELIDFIRVNY